MSNVSLTDAQIAEQFTVSQNEIFSYLRKHRLPRTARYQAVATQAIRAGKIGEAIGKEVSVANTAADWQVIYGRTRTGGALTFVHQTGDNQVLHLVYTLAGHEIADIEKVFFNEEEIVFPGSNGQWSTHSIRPDGTTNTNWANKVYIVLNNGNAGNIAIPQLVLNCPDKWTSAHKQSGCAHVYMLMYWDVTLFPDGMPDVSFEIKGKPVYDPRTATTEWSPNAALCVADYLMDSRIGLGLDQSEISMGDDDDQIGTLWNAANICDEPINVIQGGTENRYTCNGSFLVNQTPQEVLQRMMSAMVGDLVYVNGLWKIYAGAYLEPEIDLEEADILSDLVITTKISRKENFNGVKGIYINPKNRYERDDFPAYKSTYYKTQDNDEEVLEDIVLPFTTAASIAQRIAKLVLERVRQPISVEGLFSLKAFRAETPQTITLTYDRMGWTQKVFRIEEAEPVVDQQEGTAPRIAIRLKLRETAEGVYDWDKGQETLTDLAPNTDLPDPYSVGAPENLTLTSGTAELYVRTDGTVFSRIKAAWDTMADAFVSSGGRIEMEYKQSADGDWSPAATVPGTSTFAHILDVEDGEAYDVRVRSVSALGSISDWTTETNHTVVGKTEPPSDVATLTGSIESFGIALTWTPIADPDVGFYEIRQGSVWATATKVAESRGTTYKLPIDDAGTYNFLIKAVDTSGNYSTDATGEIVTIAAPAAVTVSASIIGIDVQLTWTESTGGQFATQDYAVYYGDTFGSAALVERVKSTRFRKKIDWSGNRRWWIVPRDVAGNEGAEASADLNITPPGVVVGLSLDAIDSQVLMKWSAPTSGSLPIDHYKVYKGAVFGSADLIGQVSATFSSFFEIIAGTYTYWIKAFDTAGNGGSESGSSLFVNNPPDFEINANDLLEPDTGTRIHAYVDDDEILIPVNNVETWEQHFSTNGWSTIQDAIDDGFDYLMQPTPSFAYWQKIVDYGTTLGPNLIKFTNVKEDIFGTVSPVIKLAYSTDMLSWTEETASQIFATGFRYVRVRIEVGTLPGVSGSPMGMLLALTYP